MAGGSRTGKTTVVKTIAEIFRQKDESCIISNAELIRDGKLLNLSNGLSTDLFFLERSDNVTGFQKACKLL